LENGTAKKNLVTERFAGIESVPLQLACFRFVFFFGVFILFYFFFLEKAIFRRANLFSVPAAYARYERGRENSVYSSGTNETIT